MKGVENTLNEILNVVLAQFIQKNQGEQNLIELLEARLIQIALEQVTDNKSQAARRLGIPRKQVERRVKKYQLR